jgi:hypothetical protein
VEVGVEAEVEAAVVEMEAVVEVKVEAEEVGAETHPNPNKSSSPAKMKELWDSFPKYLRETAPKPKPSWKKSKDTSALTPTSMDLTPL